MTSPFLHRVRAIAVVAIVAGGVVLGFLPPALGGEIPPTVMRSVPVALPAPADGDVGVTRLARGVIAEDPVWTRDAEACADIRFTAVGLTWEQDGDEQVPLHVAWGDGARFGASVPVLSDPDHSPDPTAPDADGRVGTPPIWTGDGRCLRFSMQLPEGEAIRDLRVEFLNTLGTAGGRGVLGSLTDGMARLWGMAAPQEAAAIARRPSIIRRSAWGADERLRKCGPSYADRLKMAYVHHTASGNTYTKSQAAAVVRSIYAYHTQSRGWCDIAYNFLVDRFGRVYEGRYGGMAKPVIGGHAMGFNTGSTGVALIGDHTTTDPSAAALRGLRKVLAWRLDVAHLNPRGTATMVSGGGSNTRYPAGQEVQLPVISGHRETGYTTCPGDRVWGRMPSIRRAVQNLGLPKIWDPRQDRGSIDIGESSVRFRANLSGALRWDLELVNAKGAAVRRWGGSASSLNVTWDGTDAVGTPVPDGTYRAVISARNPTDGTEARPAVLRVAVKLGCTRRAQPGVPLHGGDGGEVLCGTAGPDTIVGGTGDDLIVGFGGDDALRGGDGNDTLIGGPGKDMLRGGAGRDLLIAGPGRDTLVGGLDEDTVSFVGSPRAVTVDLAAGTAEGWAPDTLTGIERVTGSRFGDVLRGDDGPNLLEGGRGDDLLEGRGGDDVLLGGPGADGLVPGPGRNRLLGGEGLDTAIYRRAPTGVSVDLRAGTATGWGEDRLAGIPNVTGSSFDDRIRGDGNANRLLGGKGDDLLAGLGGHDVLVGGPGRNTLRGGGGNDRLRARNGTPDVVRGGPGTDVAMVDRRLDDVRGVERLR